MIPHQRKSLEVEAAVAMCCAAGMYLLWLLALARTGEWTQTPTRAGAIPMFLFISLVLVLSALTVFFAIKVAKFLADSHVRLEIPQEETYTEETYTEEDEAPASTAPVTTEAATATTEHKVESSISNGTSYAYSTTFETAPRETIPETDKSSLRVFAALKKSKKGLNVNAAVKATGLSEKTVRDCLKWLEAGELVTSSVKKAKGPGRPAKSYQATEAR